MNISKIKKTGTHAITATVLGLLTALPLQAEPFAYIPDYDGNISVIDTATNTEVNNIPHESGNSIAMHPSGHSFYITGPGDSVSVYDTTTNALIATIPTVIQPSDIVISPENNMVYVANYNVPGSITAIDASTNSVVATIPVNDNPHSIVVTPDGSKIYVDHLYSGRTVTVVDTATNTVTGSFDFSQNGAVYPKVFDMAAHPTEDLVYIASNAPYIHVIDTVTDSEIAKVSIGGAGYYIDVSPDGSRVYSANYTVGSVSAIDTQTNSPIGTIPTNNYPFGIRVHPSGESVYVSGFAYVTPGPITEVVVIETATHTISDRINSLGSLPTDIVISPIREDIGGNATGTQQISVVCSNHTTSQQITLSLGTATDWNCETAGLNVSSGDQIEMNILGTAK